MEIEILLSTMNLKNEEEVKKLVNKMNIKTGVVVINQINKNIKKFDYIDNNIRSYSFYEKGLSISRNRALENANEDILILADDDVKKEDDYEISPIQCAVFLPENEEFMRIKNAILNCTKRLSELQKS